MVPDLQRTIKRCNKDEKTVYGWEECLTSISKMGFKRRRVSATDRSGTGNNQERTHSLVNPSQKAGLSAGLVSNRYQSSVVLRVASIQSQGSEILELLIQRKLTENWMKAEKMPGFFLQKWCVKFPLRQPASAEEEKQCRVLSGFRLCQCQKRTWTLRTLHAPVSFLFRVSRCHGHMHFHENSSRAPFLPFLSDDLYVPNLNVNPGKNILTQF